MALTLSGFRLEERFKKIQRYEEASILVQFGTVSYQLCIYIAHLITSPRPFTNVEVGPGEKEL